MIVQRLRIRIGNIRIDAAGIPPVLPILVVVLAAAGAVARFRGWI